jgi:hypothetical protein
VHVSALALAQAGLLAEHFGRHFRHAYPFCDGEVVRAMSANDGVASAQMGADADSNRLLASGQVHLARYRARANIEGQALLYVG